MRLIEIGEITKRKYTYKTFTYILDSNYNLNMISKNFGRNFCSTPDVVQEGKKIFIKVRKLK